MDIKIEGNPGTGNSYIQITVEQGGVNNVNPAATTVNNTTIIYGDGKDALYGDDMDDREKQIIKTAILEFVGKLKAKVRSEWVNKYDTLWVSILALPEVDAEIYNKGNQHHVLFNRQLVGKIVKVMLDKNVFVEGTTPTDLSTLIVSGNESFRKEMGKYPSDDLHQTIKDLIDNQ